MGEVVELHSHPAALRREGARRRADRRAALPVRLSASRYRCGACGECFDVVPSVHPTERLKLPACPRCHPPRELVSVSDLVGELAP